MSSTDRTLSKINIFTNLTALKNHTETEIGDTELSIVGEIAVVVETYKNGSSWYRIWSDGWIEQGGNVYVSTSGQPLNFLKAFSDTTYTIVSGGSAAQLGNTSCYNKTATGCSLWTSDDNSFNASGIEWYACGY